MEEAVRRPMTVPEFLDWEQRQPTRFEFDGVRVLAMTGGTAAHAGIQGNLAVAIRGRLRGGPCQFFGSDLKVEVAGRVRYPDGFVVCSEVGRLDRIVRDPVVIFEVLSDSTASTDLVTKNREYAATPSVRRYVVLSQNEIGGTMFERQGDDWVGRILDAGTVLHLPEIGIEIPIGDFYVDVPIIADDETVLRDA